MAKKDEVLKHKELGKVVVKQDNRDDGQKLKDFIKENISSMLGSDGEPDLGKIRDILGLSSLNGYELKFPGKGIANALYSAPIYKELKNIDENKSNKINENFIIKGDNLDALKILAKGYTNKIKMIYIDPPYNTMNNDFIYNDNFRADFDAIARISGLIDESGNKSKNLEEMERIFKGTRTHSAWLCFMYPRLKLARDLLKDDGVIFISIDDNEQANLKLLCDEIFGEENFISIISMLSNPRGRQSNKFIAQTHEYLFVYAKNSNFLYLKGEELTKEQEKEYNLCDERGKYRLLGLRLRGGRATAEESPTLHFPIFYNPRLNDFYLEKKQNDDIEIIPKFSNGVLGTWRWSKDKIIKQKNDLIVKLVKDRYDVFQKDYLTQDKTRKLKSIWYEKEINYDNSAKELTNLGLEDCFNYAKPTYLVRKLVEISTNPNDNDIILDFFAGSGTTAHAVMAQNLADNGNRKFILVQLDESIDEKKSKTAFDFCKNELKSSKPNISDITIERVKRAKKALNSQMEFSVYEMTDEPDIDVQENLFGARQIINPLDLVTNMLLKSGNEISGKNIECVIENRLYKVGNDYFVLDLLQKDDKELFKVLDKDRNGNVYADIYINCDIEVWLNFYAKFKERLRIL